MQLCNNATYLTDFAKNIFENTVYNIKSAHGKWWAQIVAARNSKKSNLWRETLDQIVRLSQSGWYRWYDLFANSTTSLKKNVRYHLEHFKTMFYIVWSIIHLGTCYSFCSNSVAIKIFSETLPSSYLIPLLTSQKNYSHQKMDSNRPEKKCLLVYGRHFFSKGHSKESLESWSFM